MTDSAVQPVAASPFDLCQNRLLATFPEELRDLLQADAELLRLDEGMRLLTRGEQVRRSIFPCGRTIISLVVDLDGSRSIEAASIGSEGAIGGIISCGHSPSFAHADVTIGGTALAIPMEAIERAKRASRHLEGLFCRYSDYLLAQLLQGTACSAFHPIEARTARWLLATLERAGPSFSLTQDALARLLGVQRTTINAVIGRLEAEGMIETRRGQIAIVGRERLEARSCGCTATIERFYGDVIGPSGTGGSAG